MSFEAEKQNARGSLSLRFAIVDVLPLIYLIAMYKKKFAKGV